jgi:molecular chaperone DnaK (HSP70)
VFIIVDAGGGTVDVQMHEIKRHGYSEALDELSVPLGAFCGSTFVDEAFVKLLQRTFTKTTIDAIKSEQSVVIQKLLAEFEKVKRKFTGVETEPYYLDLPEPLYEAHEEGYEVLEETEGPKYKINDEMQLVLEIELLKAMFDPQLQEITKMITEHNEHPQVEAKPTIVLVGGFSASQYLQRRIREAFPENIVVTPAKPGEAVLQGAVYYGWNPKALMSRRARFSFGIKNMMLCGDDFDYTTRKYVWNHSKNANYYEAFQPLVTKGEKLPMGMTVPLLFCPFEYSQTSCTVPLSSCDDYIADSRAIDEITAAISNLCSATVSMPDTTKRGDREILVEFTVGNVEMGVHAKDLSSGNEAEVSVDFSKANKDQTQTMYLPSNPTSH